MMVLKGFDGPWTASVITAFRFILLFSYLVPISLRVNLDMSKIFYCKMIERDKRIPGELFNVLSVWPTNPWRHEKGSNVKSRNYEINPSVVMFLN